MPARTVARYRTRFGHAVREFGDRPAGELRPAEVLGLADRSGWALSTQNGFVGALVTAFRWAVRAGLLSDSPLKGIQKPPKERRGARTFLPAAEQERLLAARDPAFRQFVLGLRLTGARPGELDRVTAADEVLAHCRGDGPHVRGCWVVDLVLGKS